MTGPDLPREGKIVEATVHEATPVTVSGAAGEIPSEDSIPSFTLGIGNEPKIAKAHGGNQARTIIGDSDLKLVATAKVVDTSSPPCTKEAEPVTRLRRRRERSSRNLSVLGADVSASGYWGFKP